MNKFLTIIGLIALATVMTYVDYLMIQKIYGYTLVSCGAPPLTLIQLLGVGFFIRAISMNNSPTTSDTRSNKMKIIDASANTCVIAFLWGCSYLIFG